MATCLAQLLLRSALEFRTTARGLLRNAYAFVVLVCIVYLSALRAQTAVPTSRVDNSRSNSVTNETLLTPANVNVNGFGHLFRVGVDDVVMAQPLYVPGVEIPDQGTHNVVYVATQADTVYAVDGDNGDNIWKVRLLEGGMPASGDYLPCGTGNGFSQEGIVGTPVIDLSANTIFLVAKTLLSTTVRHHLHALDITTGKEKAGSPVLIAARSTSDKGNVTVFNSLHEKNRPGLLLSKGAVYLGFGSNGCNDADTGWILAYDETSLTQLSAFNTSPDYGLTSVWQAGVGLAADQAGNIFFETAEAGANGFDVPSGGQTYCNTVLRLSPNLSVSDYFTPWSVAYLNSHDLDLSSSGAVLLPDQDGANTHELIASGKQGYVYVLDRDHLGMYSPGDSEAVQEIALVPGATRAVQFGSPAYWNNTVYFAPNGAPLMAFPLSGGLLGTPKQTSAAYPGSHSPSISANGKNNGILWALTGQLRAFDASSLQLLYSTDQAPNGRDSFPDIGHFVTQTVANGRVYVGTQNTLEAFGLLQILNISGTPVSVDSPGATTGNTSTITVAPVNEFAGEVDLSCTLASSPTAAQNPPTCSLPGSVNITGESAASVTMTIHSTPATSGGLRPLPPNRTIWLAVNGAIVFGMAFFGVQARATVVRNLSSGVVTLLVLALLGCGGGSSHSQSAGTTPGSYKFRVTGTSHGYLESTTVKFTIN